MVAKSVAKDLWEAWLVRGVITVIFGVAAVFWPGLTIATLVYLFGAFVLVSGIVTIINGILDVKNNLTWFLTILVGGFELGVGVYLLRHPLLSFLTLILLIGFVLIARGIIEIVHALLESTSATTRTLDILSGLFALAVGIFILFQKASASVAFVWLLGFYAIVVGCMRVSVAIEARRLLDQK